MFANSLQRVPMQSPESQLGKPRGLVSRGGWLALALAVGCDSEVNGASMQAARNEKIGSLSAAQAEALCEEANAVARATHVDLRGWCALHPYSAPAELDATCEERVRFCVRIKWAPQPSMVGLDCAGGAILRDSACGEATAGDYLHCVAELSNRAEAVFDEASCSTAYQDPGLTPSVTPREACQAILARCPETVPTRVLDTWLLSGGSPNALHLDVLRPVFEARDRAHDEFCEIALQCYPNGDTPPSCRIPIDRTFTTTFDDYSLQENKAQYEACLEIVSLFERGPVERYGVCNARAYRALGACIEGWRCPDIAESCYVAFTLALDDCYETVPQSVHDHMDTYCDGTNGLSRF
jgi:hypothetical protein